MQFSIPKANHTFNISASQFAEHILEKLVYFGLKRKLDNVLADESLEKYRALEDNSGKTLADFEAFAKELVQTQISKLLAGEWREGGGGGSKVEALLKEAIACLARSYGWTGKQSKAIKTWADIESVLWQKAQDKFKASGQKFAKQNVDYMAGAMLDKVKAKAQDNLDEGDFEVDINTAK